MTIKLLLLKSGEDVIADVTEMTAGEKTRVVGYFLNKPCVVRMRDPDVLSEEPKGPTKTGFAVSLYPWMPLCKEDVIPISADWLITMVEPIDKLTKKLGIGWYDFSRTLTSTIQDKNFTGKFL